MSDVEMSVSESVIETADLTPDSATEQPVSEAADVTPAAHGEWQLPDEPVVRIRPSSGMAALNLREVWAYRELLYFLAWRDIKVRYKQTVLGVAWAVLQPVCTTIIFTLFFGTLAGLPSDGVPKILFFFVGSQLWTYFSGALGSSGNSLVGSQNLITKVYFPRMIIPAAAVMTGLVDFIIACGILAAMMAYYQYLPSWQIIFAPVCVALASLLALGVGMWMSGLNVKYRDIRYALPFLIQLGMFVSPIIYPLSMIREKSELVGKVMLFNPLTGIIENFRASLFGLPMDFVSLGISALITAAILVFAAFSFRKMEKSFADVV